MVMMNTLNNSHIRNMAVGRYILLICFSLTNLLSISKAHVPRQQAGDSSAILLQAFHWHSANCTAANCTTAICSADNCTERNWYKTVLDKVDDLKNLGITHAWINPASDSCSAEGYLPRRLNILDSCYGSAEDLKRLCKAFNERDIQCVADVVINHRVGTTGYGDFTEPKWSEYSICIDDEWGRGKGNPDTGEGFSAARDLDHINVMEVQNGIKEWMTKVLKPIFSGIRFDLAKGFKPEYFGLYANAFEPEFCVGEWYGRDRQQMIDWVDGTGKACGAFDFTTKFLLKDALADGYYGRLRDNDGKPGGMIGWWPAMSVTFVDNHDTAPSDHCGSGLNYDPIPCDKAMEGYAYILTHPGIPTVYYPHIYHGEMNKEIDTLIKVRKSAGITSTSAVEIHRAEHGLYAATVTGKLKKLAMKIGPNSWSPDGKKLLCSGNNYAVWES